MKTLEELVLEIAHRTCTTYSHLAREKCSFADHHTRDFATKLIAAWKEQQEPVAWCYVQSGYTHYTDDKRDWYDAPGIEEVTPLFLAPPPAVPEGYVLVPKEPSEEMCAEGCLKVGALYGHHGARSMYQAMIAAAQGEQE